MKKQSVEQLVAEYREAAAQHGKMSTVDPRVANTAGRKLLKAYKELKSRGEEASLLPLLEVPDEGVRGWAGGHALAFAPGLAVPVLETLAEKGANPAMAIAAKYSLREWRAGRRS